MTSGVPCSRHLRVRPNRLAVLRSVMCTLLLVAPAAPPALAYATAGAQVDPATPDSTVDMTVVQSCVNTLASYGLTSDAPTYLDALTVCYTVESAPDIPLDPLPVADVNINNGGACFADGSSVRVSQAEIDDLSQWGRDNGRTMADVKGDIEALNVSRGGSGNSTCPKPPQAAPQNVGGVKCDSNFDSIDDAIAWEQGRVKDAETHLKQLEIQTQPWKIADQLSNWRAEFYVMDQVLSANNLGLFDPLTPDKKFAQIDRRYHKPRYGDFVAPDSMVLVDLSEAIPAWQASPEGLAAQAEKDAYALFDTTGKLTGGTYKQKMDSINSYRTLPKDPNDIHNLGRPAEMLKQIQEQQDYDILILQRAQQDLTVWQQAKANGVNCSFSTGQLGHPVFAPIAKAEPLFAFVLEGIGVVITTVKDVASTPACQWTGGGPRPCPGAKPAKIVSQFGGPYDTEAQARADLKSRMECGNGYWGPWANIGGIHPWLQNNVSLSDCKSVK